MTSAKAIIDSVQMGLSSMRSCLFHHVVVLQDLQILGKEIAYCPTGQGN